MKCVLFVLLLWGLDKVFLIPRNDSMTHVEDTRLRRVLDGQIDADLIILGSSRGDESIVNPELERLTGLTTFNLSYHGTEIEWSTFLLKLLLKHNRKPRVIVKNVDEPHEFTKTAKIRFRYDQLYPLVAYPDIREELYRRGQRNELVGQFFVAHQISWDALWFHRYPAPSAPLLKYGSLVGDTPLPVPFKEYKRDSTLDLSHEVPEMVASFKEFERICQANGITLILSIAPNYWEPVKGFNEHIARTKDPASHLFLYDSTDPVYQDSTYFSDITHLNERGAEVYTRELAEFINQVKR